MLIISAFIYWNIGQFCTSRCHIYIINKLFLIEKFIHFAQNKLGQTYDHVAKTDRDHKYLAEGWQKLLTLDKDISRIWR